jgi:hypothetical protein
VAFGRRQARIVQPENLRGDELAVPDVGHAERGVAADREIESGLGKQAVARDRHAATANGTPLFWNASAASGVTLSKAYCHAAVARGISTMPSPTGIRLAARMPSVDSRPRNCWPRH